MCTNCNAVIETDVLIQSNYKLLEPNATNFSFCPTDMKFATGSDDATARIWDFARCTEERVLRGHGADVRSVDWHPIKGLLATGSRDSQQPVKLWDPRSGQCLATLHDHKNSVMAVQWNKNGNWLLSGSRDHMIKLYDVRMMKEVQTFRGHRKEVTSLSWHPVHEGLFVSGGGDGSLGYWMVNTEKELALLEQAHDQAIWTLEWHPLGHILSTGSNDNNTKFWARNRPGDTQEDIFGLTALTGIPTGVLTSTAPFTATVATEIAKKDLEETEEKAHKTPLIPGMGLGENIIDEINRDISTIPALGGTAIDDINDEALREANKKMMLKQPPPKKAQQRMWMVSRPTATNDGDNEDGYERMESDGHAHPSQFRQPKASLLGPPPSGPSMLGLPPVQMPPRMPTILSQNSTSWRQPNNKPLADSWKHNMDPVELDPEEDVDMRIATNDMDEDVDFRAGRGPPIRAHQMPPHGAIRPLGNFPGNEETGGFFQAPPMPQQNSWINQGPPPQQHSLSGPIRGGFFNRPAVSVRGGRAVIRGNNGPMRGRGRGRGRNDQGKFQYNG